MNKIIKMSILIIVIIIVAVAIAGFVYFFAGKAQVKDNITWGVDFSQSQTEYFKLDWKEAYLAIINDLGVKNIKLHTNWNWVENIKDDFYFEDIDWQIKQAEQNNVKIIYVLGMKTGRWPECHIPEWAPSLSKDDQQKELLKYITEVVQRYKNSKAIAYWQVENEPLFKFGGCPAWYYENDSFLKTEVALVKSLDPTREIIISDSGEQSAWLNVAKIGDIVGITMYRNAWAHMTDTVGFNINYAFLNPMTYARKAEIVKKMSGKNVICIELQAEPWVSSSLMTASLEDQKKSMNLDIFEENIEFAKQTGLDKFYLWGVEWWYWMKTVQNQPEIWNQAKTLFKI
jgi:hypothetical protein